MTLDGLEEVVRKSCPSRRKVNFIRYADDLISTADSKELIENNIIPAVNTFLKPRGLMLSPEKTKIVRIEEGFDFLGQHLQKFHNKLLITPSKKNTKSFLDKVRGEIKAHRGCKCEDMIQKLNPIIRGWSNYHKHIQASETFLWADKIIYWALRRWARRRHSNKGPRWIKQKYFRSQGGKWRFSHKFKDRNGKKRILELLRPSLMKLMRYIKIKGESNAFDPKYTSYFIMRRRLSNTVPIGQ